MATLNPRDAADLPAIDAAGAAGVGVLVKKALLSGHVDELRRAAPDLLADCGGDPAEACMRFALGRNSVSSVIVGTTNPAHLRADVAAAEHAAGGE